MSVSFKCTLENLSSSGRARGRSLFIPHVKKEMEGRKEGGQRKRRMYTEKGGSRKGEMGARKEKNA